MPVFRSPPPTKHTSPPPPQPVFQHDPQPHNRQPQQQQQQQRDHDSSFASNVSASLRAGSLPNASIPSTPSHAAPLYPALPDATPNASQRSLRPPPPPADEFPSLDEMAEAGRRKKEMSARNHASTSSTSSSSLYPPISRTYTVSTSTSRVIASSSTSVQVPSSLPRPNKARVGSLYAPQNAERNTARRSSLTAMEAARKRAGDETPAAIADARAQRKQIANLRDASFDDDDDGNPNDTSAALVAGPHSATSANLSIDVEGGRMPVPRRSVGRRISGDSHPGGHGRPSHAAPFPEEADFSIEKQKSTRRNGEDRPVTSGYDFSKYLDQDLDPFNVQGRKGLRRDSRPLPLPPPDIDGGDHGDDEGDRHGEVSRSSFHSGDDTLRGGNVLPPSRQSARSAPQQQNGAAPVCSGKQEPPAQGDDAGSYDVEMEEADQRRRQQQQQQSAVGKEADEDAQATPKPSKQPASHPDASVGGRSVSDSMLPPSQLPRSRIRAQPAAMAPPPTPVPMPMQSTPRMTPQMGSRKISHLSAFSVPGVPLVAADHAGAGTTGAASDESGVTASAQKRRLDPAARTDRLMSLELAEAKKKLKLLEEKLEISEDQRRRTLEESEGWASEAARLEEDVARLRLQLETEAAYLQKATAELEAKVVQHKLESDEQRWRAVCLNRGFGELEADLVYCKNETTYESYHAKEVEAELLKEKDELRLRLMAERRRSDVLAAKLKARLAEALVLRKRLSSRSSNEADLRSENDALTAGLEALRAEAEALQGEAEAARNEVAELRKQLLAAAKNAKQSDEAKELRRELDEIKADMATHLEREEMMAETRKMWRKERKEMQAQIEELQAQLQEQAEAIAKRSASNAKHGAAAVRAEENDEFDDDDGDGDGGADAVSDDSLAAAPTTKKRAPASKASRRQPMQGASDAIPSEAELPMSSPSPKTAKKKSAATGRTKAPAASALARSALAAASNNARKRGRRGEADELIEAASDQSDGDAPFAPAAAKKGGAAVTRAKATSGKAKGSGAAMGRGRKPKAPIAVEYDDQTADPSATPMIRSKRSMDELLQMKADEDGDAADGRAGAAEVDGSFAGRGRAASRTIGQDSTNAAATAAAAKCTKGAAPAPPSPQPSEQPQKKKKRKLLGRGAAGLMSWANAADENDGLQPDYNIPLELSPIKPAAGGGRLGMFAGFGSGRGPFA
ncbi:hypothetical protein ACQY0O_006566 [Thecaphora frezii]